MPLPVRRGSLITGTTSSGGGGGGGGGVFVNVKDHGATGNGVTDETASLNLAITYIKSLPNGGGGRLYFPMGLYNITGSLLLDATTNNITFYGDGPGSVLLFTGSIPAGKGRFDLAGCSYITFEAMRIDGGVHTSTQIDWSVILSTADPAQTALTQNSMFWVHGGTVQTKFRKCVFTHTGGYLAYLDATSVGDVDGVEFDSCDATNNRPHTFGSGGVNTYQSWTGGIHAQGDGVNFCVKNLSIHDSSFRRSPGSQIWSHLYAFTKLHKNFKIDNCLFEDVGLEGVEIGGVDGFSVTNCTFHRVGFVTGNSDTATPTPAWLANHQSTALDTSGLATNGVYANNTFLNCNGGSLDMDGFGQGTVSGNTGVISQPGDAEYTTDQVSSFGPGGAGPQYCYGVNCDNTSNTALGGASNVISGNFFSKYGGAEYRYYACRNCTMTGNMANHPASGYIYAPVMYGPVSASANQRATGNVITDNTINWNPGTFSAAIVEDPSVAAFVNTDKNWVTSNHIALGSNVWEFSKDPNSGSVVRIVMSSMASGLSTSSETWMQREAALTRWYKNVAGISVPILTLQDAGSYASAPATPGPLLNVTNGTGFGGTITTGSRTLTAFDDAMVTGKMYADAFLTLADTTYADSDANLLHTVSSGVTASVAMLRYRPTIGYIEQSITIAAGARVWIPLSITSVAGADTQIQFNKAGVFGADPTLSFDYTNLVLQTPSITATGRILTNNAFVASALTTQPALPTIGFAKIYFDNTLGRFLAAYFPTGASSSTPYVGLGVPSGSDKQVQFNGSGFFAADSNFTYDYTNLVLTVPNITATGRILTNNSYAIQALSSAPPLPSSGFAKLYFDNTLGKFMAAYFPTGAGSSTTYIGLGVPAGSNLQVQFNSSGNFAADTNLTYDFTNQLLTTVNITATGRILTNGNLGFAALGSAPPLPTVGFAKIYFDNTLGRLMGAYFPTGAGSSTSYVGLGVPAGSNLQVQFNSSGFFAADANLTFDFTNQLLTTVNVTATGRVLANGSYSSAAQSLAPSLPTSGFAKFYFDNPSGVMKISYFPTGAGSATAYATFGGSPSGVTGSIQFNSSGTFASDVNLTYDTFNQLFTTVNVTATGRILTNGNVGFASLSSAPSLPTSGFAKVYFDTTLGRLMAAYFPTGAGSSTTYIGLGVPSGSTQQVQFNSSGNFAADSNLTYDSINQLLTTVNVTGTGRILANGSYSSAAQSIAPSLPSSGFAKWYFDNTAGVLKISYFPTGAGSATAYAPIASGVPSVNAITSAVTLTPQAGSGITVSNNVPVAGSITIGLSAAGSNSYVQFNNSTSLGADSNFNYTSPGTSGLLTLPNLTANGRVLSAAYVASIGSAPALPATGFAKWYFDSTTNVLMISYNVSGIASSYAPLSGSGGSSAGTSGQIQYAGVSAGAFAASSNFTWTTASQLLSVNGLAGTAAIATSQGYIQSFGGFIVNAATTNWNSIQTQGGIVSTKAVQVGQNYTVDQSAAANGFLVHTVGTNLTSGVTCDVYDTFNNPFADFPVFVGRRLQGTPNTGSFSATQSGFFLFSVGARGSTTSGPVSTASAKVNFMATENWSTSAQGAELQFGTTRNLTTTNNIAMYVRNTGVVECMFGTYLHFGAQCDSFISFLSSASSPSFPSSGYGAVTHRSGSTWWYYNPSVGWSIVDFAASGGGGVPSVDGITTAVTLVQAGGLVISNNVPVAGSISLSVNSSIVPYLANNQTFTGLNTFTSATTFTGGASFGLFNLTNAGITASLQKIVVGNNVSGVTAGTYCGPGVLSQFGILGSGHNVYLANNGNGTWQVAAGGGTASASKQITVLTSTLPTFITLYFIGGVLVGDSNTSGIYYNNFAVTAPY